MEEYFDVCDEEGKPTGEVVSRSVAHERGILHRTAHVWIVRKGNEPEVLLQKRSNNKDSFPGYFDTSSAGHIPAGQEVVTSALRELEEELGLVAGKEKLLYVGKFRISYTEEFHGKPFSDNEVAFVFVYQGEVDEKRLVLQEEEIESVKWFSLRQVCQECGKENSCFCVPEGGLKLVSEYFQGEAS